MFGFAKLRVCLALITVSSALAFTSTSEGFHPDGRSTTYRGWGPTRLSETSYTCTLFNPSGSQAGAITFPFAAGNLDVELGGRDAHFAMQAGGIVTVHALDEATFPNLADVPLAYKTPGHSLLRFTVRAEVGVNVQIAEPVTPLAQSLRSVDVHCTYIINELGVPVFCVNCVFVVC